MPRFGDFHKTCFIQEGPDLLVPQQMSIVTHQHKKTLSQLKWYSLLENGSTKMYANAL